MDAELERIHGAINACRFCATRGCNIAKPEPIDRGGVSRIVIIGKEPGRTEMTSGRAFSGQAGRRLEQWLSMCGIDSFRSSVYLTSVIKCASSTSGDFAFMRRACAKFLNQQLATIRPRAIVTLGKEAFEAMNLRYDYSESIGRVFDTRLVSIVTPWGSHCKVIVWPHPSGSNRWLNSPANRARLEESFREARIVFQQEQCLSL